MTLLFLGIAIWIAVIGNYWAASFFSGLALFIAIRAVRRARVTGPALKFGRAGIWTDKLGFKTWRQVVAVMKVHMTFRGGTSLYLCILQRGSSSQLELHSIPANDLVVDAQTLQVWLKKYTAG
ncbi:hypothetical protein [Hymenobacter perfusus]|uniref:hypothetical protein n=1 Tax=Hymenobacter perfusus TaxID=1236770 RepID=UPI001476C419|nr:hypothetical protein [Hymenobacter perfusus]